MTEDGPRGYVPTDAELELIRNNPVIASAIAQIPLRTVDCIHLGLPLEETGKRTGDESGTICECRGKWKMGCSIYGTTSIANKRSDVNEYCQTCTDYMADT